MLDERLRIMERLWRAARDFEPWLDWARACRRAGYDVPWHFYFHGLRWSIRRARTQTLRTRFNRASLSGDAWARVDHVNSVAISLARVDLHKAERACLRLIRLEQLPHRRHEWMNSIKSNVECMIAARSSRVRTRIPVDLTEAARLICQARYTIPQAVEDLGLSDAVVRQAVRNERAQPNRFIASWARGRQLSHHERVRAEDSIMGFSCVICGAAPRQCCRDGPEAPFVNFEDLTDDAQMRAIHNVHRRRYQHHETT